MAGDHKQQYPVFLAWARPGVGELSMGCASRQGQKDEIKKDWGDPHAVWTGFRGG